MWPLSASRRMRRAYCCDAAGDWSDWSTSRYDDAVCSCPVTMQRSKSCARWEDKNDDVGGGGAKKWMRKERHKSNKRDGMTKMIEVEGENVRNWMTRRTRRKREVDQKEDKQGKQK